LAAILACSAQDDIVSGDEVSAPVGNALDGGFERRVREGLDPSAVVADEVVMVVVVRVRRLEAGDSVAEVDTLDEPERVHAFERAIHARDPDACATRAYLLVELVG
jgi:hypothetical protein